MTEAEETPIPVDEIDLGSDPSATWLPRWIVDCGRDCEVGIAVDDHCFVVLAKTFDGQWHPTKHIPRQAAEKLGELADHSVVY